VSAQRGSAALAAMITALLLQGTLIGPLATAVPLSLPAVLVAAAALVEGPTTGMAFGFSLGLVADLGSSHPAGILALAWLSLGLVCGLAGDRRTVLGDVVIAAVCCALATLFAGLLLAVVHAGGATAWVAARGALPAGLGDAVLALAVIPLVRGFLRTETLRARRGLVPGIDLGTPRG
jgi:cell shape-determining protein MreD